MRPLPPTPRKWTKEEVLDAIDLGYAKIMKHADYDTIIGFEIRGERINLVRCTLRRNKQMEKILPKLPALGCDTRWLSYLDVVEDIIELADLIVLHRGHLPEDISEKIYAIIMHKLDDLKTLRAIWEPLRAPVTQLQSETKVSLYTVAPKFLKLLNQYQKGMADPNETVRILSKAAYMALQKNKDETVVDVHYAAALLSPKHKFLHGFSDDERDKAYTYVQARYKEMKDAIPLAQLKKRSRHHDDSSDDDDFQEDELSAYLGLPRSKTDPATYWKTTSETFPILSSVARSIYAIPASEAACERQFSIAAHIITKQRSSLSPESAEKVVLGRQLSALYSFDVPDVAVENEVAD